ncbi:MAG TPA: GGDEF domain-containing protein [Solirubrobacterales bacterium]
MSGNDRSRKGGSKRAPDGGAGKKRPGEADPQYSDQTASDLDQTLSDLDQSTSDADQNASDVDQVQSDTDQLASDRDQAAADRERAVRTSEDGGAGHAYEESSADRLTSTRARNAATFDRAATSAARHENAGRRDETARLRDLSSEARDKAAEVRDRQAEAYEKAFGARTSEAAVRKAAASDRARAAADRAAAAADRAQAGKDREWARAELEMAQLDDLTGVYRRELGIAVIQREIDRARRSDGRLVLAFIDVDGLKAVNDGDGHAAGDALLIAATASIQAELRSYDPVVRFGGDEFVCAIGGTDLESAAERFEAIARRFAETGKGRSITVGLAALRPEDSIEDLLERGDEDLLASRSA